MLSNKAKKYDSISSYAYMLGFFLNLSRIYLKNSIIGIISGILYLTGGVFWHLASRLYPSHQSHENRWYGFAEFKDQLSTSAIIGVLSTLFHLASMLYMPQLVIVSSVLNFISGVFWYVAEHHHQQNPQPFDIKENSPKQAAYVKYIFYITNISFITMNLSVINFYFPQIYNIALQVSIPFFIGAVGLALKNFYAYITFKLSPPPPSEADAHTTEENASPSYRLIINELGPSPTQNLSNQNEPQEVSSKSLFNTQETTALPLTSNSLEL